MKVWAVEEWQHDSLLNYTLFLSKDKAYENIEEVAEKENLEFVPGYHIRYENEVSELWATLVEEEVIE